MKLHNYSIFANIRFVSPFLNKPFKTFKPPEF